MDGSTLYPNIKMDLHIDLEDCSSFYYSTVFSKELETKCSKDHTERSTVKGNECYPSMSSQSNLDPPKDSKNSHSLYFDGSEADMFSSVITQDHNSLSSTAISGDNIQRKEDIPFQKDEKLGGRSFYYEAPLVEETGPWIPVSVPPLSESDREEWMNGLHIKGGYLPEEDLGWQHDDQVLTMWTVVSELLAVATKRFSSSLLSTSTQSTMPAPNRPFHRGIMEQAWKEMAETLTESTYNSSKNILDCEPPRWIPDSATTVCMLCNVRFHPILCPRHHCRFCGGIFCGNCSRGRSLLPERFRVSDPQRVCDICWVRLEPVQGLLMKKVAHAVQPATHDVTDLSTLRSWLNFPWGQSMQCEIYKAANTVSNFIKIGILRPEGSIPALVLKHAKGLAVITVLKVGTMITYKVGTGLVIARRDDGLWSAPAAISSFGIGWGVQAGGELTDFIIVLRTSEAVKTFSGDVHFSLGAGLSVAAGPVGRVIEADIRAGSGGSASCYTYSCSKGAFVGCSLEGNIVTCRNSTNQKFYGNLTIRASDILIGTVPRPIAAGPLYNALSDLFDKACK